MTRRLTKLKIDQVKDCKSGIWRFEIQPESTILVESRGLLTRVYLPRLAILVPLGPARVIVQWELGPSITIVEIWDYIVCSIVICIEPNRILETWPPIYRGQERPAKDRLRLNQLSTSLFSNTHQILPCLSESLPSSSSDALFPRS
jgi:hypothetical protein